MCHRCDNIIERISSKDKSWLKRGVRQKYGGMDKTDICEKYHQEIYIEIYGPKPTSDYKERRYKAGEDGWECMQKSDGRRPFKCMECNTIVMLEDSGGRRYIKKICINKYGSVEHIGCIGIKCQTCVIYKFYKLDPKTLDKMKLPCDYICIDCLTK